MHNKCYAYSSCIHRRARSRARATRHATRTKSHAATVTQSELQRRRSDMPALMGRSVLPLVLSTIFSRLGELVCTAASLPSHVDGHWVRPPTGTPGSGCPDGPVMGNGAVGVAVSAGNGTLVFHIDRNDAWVPATGDISACGTISKKLAGAPLAQSR